MADILIRDLDDKVIKRLKKRAKDHGRSLQGEVKFILEGQAPKMSNREAVAQLKKWQRMFKRSKKDETTAMLREDRGR